jgi:hypothetical protein
VVELVFIAMFPVILLKVRDLTVNPLLGELLRGVWGGGILRHGKTFLLPLTVLEMGRYFAPAVGGCSFPVVFLE